MNQQTMTLPQAKACAYQASRAVQTTMEFRQVGGQSFIYCERGATNTGVLVGAFRKGEVVA